MAHYDCSVCGVTFCMDCCTYCDTKDGCKCHTPEEKAKQVAYYQKYIERLKSDIAKKRQEIWTSLRRINEIEARTEPRK